MSGAAGSARDYATISPSARALLLVRAATELPYARRAAELVFGAEEVARALGGDPLRRIHFERRARSLDQALAVSGCRRVLEIAAGFGFRGLALAAERADVVYFDTDLPAVAETKRALVAELHPAPLAGRLEVRALDALDPDSFAAAVEAMPPGELAIVHEGLLMYLGPAEKERLAGLVHASLRARGGVWITADVYVRSEHHLPRDAKTEQFLRDHRVEENKFADFDAAERWFASAGFRIEHRDEPPGDSWRVRETWTMRV